MMTEQETLYSMACDCADARLSKKCKNKFGDFACVNCGMYIANHSQASMQELKLFMYSADTDMARVNHQLKYYSATAYMLRDIRDFILGLVKFLAISGIIIGLLYGAYKVITYKDKPKVLIPNYQKIAVVQTDLDKVKSVDAVIRTTLELVKDDWTQYGDYYLPYGADAAITFYRYYPDKGNCGIWSNAGVGIGGWTFNAVRIDGVWRAIDPTTHRMEGGRKKSYFINYPKGTVLFGEYTWDPDLTYDAWHKYKWYCEQ